ncbi:HAMP domain-containing sensor histidine kinase [Virgisporangium ochraceum]|uniref:histidine kinase n=1 Tax=Virgisporangium ochraceum TaxID=65505 RepID=A0A8J3ZT84_9ACTN|nr:HAMP domain-containing sensor histidine kinase [Virgisporangium ochraceum]GIJ67628.1 two-component sensor histidine kinase [Virgisporangium ochraceum]
MSLRSRLLLVCMALLTLGVLVTDAVAVTMLRQHLVDRVDSQIRLLATVLSRVPIQATGQLPAEFRTSFDMISDVYVAEVAPDGSVVAAARTPGPAAVPRLPASVAARAGETFDVPGWRVMVAQRPAGGNVVVVAARLTAVDSTVRRMWTVSGLTFLAVLAVLAALGWFAMRVGLRPLRRMEETATAIAGGDLTHRVPEVARPGTEVGRLAASLNGMLAQLERAFAARSRSEARMRALLGDVSHELRTPLFGIKGFTELYRMGGLPTRDDVDRTMSHIEREATRLASLAEDLLLLATVDERPDVLAPTPMDLRTIAADMHGDLRALDPSRPVTVTGPGGTGPPGRAAVLGDEPRLRQVATNLVGNAIAHTPPGTPVRIGVGTVGGEAVLELADEGPGLDAAAAARVFDRFYRADTSRRRAAGSGAGLGLTIVRSLVAAHGGRVDVRTAPGEGATFRVLLPETAGYAGGET